MKEDIFICKKANWMIFSTNQKKKNMMTLIDV